MTTPDVPHRLRISRTADGVGVTIHSNYRTLYFSNAMFDELSNMISTMRATGVHTLQNYEDLPTRTPLHANTPVRAAKATLDDLA
jgi:hypothetical protein